MRDTIQPLLAFSFKSGDMDKRIPLSRGVFARYVYAIFVETENPEGRPKHQLTWGNVSLYGSFIALT
jgi:hypothetical protein